MRIRHIAFVLAFAAGFGLLALGQSSKTSKLPEFQAPDFSKATSCPVVRVVDGDTIIVGQWVDNQEFQVNVRLIGVGPLTEVLAWQYGPTGLLLIGGTGGGKTRAAWLLLRRLFDEGRKIKAFDCLAFAHEIGRRFRDGEGEDGPETWIDSLAETEIVFFDDFAKNVFTDRAESEIFGLIERRTANLLPIIATSNLTGADIERKTSADRGAPLVRRLREFCEVVIFDRPAGGQVDE